MPAITSSTVSNAIPTIVADEILKVLVGNLVMVNLVDRSDQYFPDGGNVAQIPIAPTMTVNNLAEGGTVQLQSPGLGSASIVLNMHPEATFQIPDVTRVIAQPDLINVYAGSAMVAMAERVERDLLGVGFSATLNATIGGASSPITEAVLDTGETSIFTNKVPQDGRPLRMVVAPQTYSELRQIPRFSELQTAASGFNDPQMNTIKSGVLGEIKKIAIFRSQYVNAVAGTYTQMLFHPSAIGFANKTASLPMPMPGTGAVGSMRTMNGITVRVIMSYAPNSLGTQFTADMFYGVGVVRPSLIQLIQNN